MIPSQPYLRVVDNSGKSFLINENNIVWVKKFTKGEAQRADGTLKSGSAKVCMSNGDIFMLASPTYADFEIDYMIRKDTQ